MSQTQERPFVTGLGELEKTFQEYKNKLEHAQREADLIIEGAWKKAEEIIADKHQEANKIIDNASQKAGQEADRVIREANIKASEIKEEAVDKAKKEIVANTQKEATKIIDDANQKAGQEADRIIREAKKTATRIEEEAIDKAKNQAKDKTKREVEKIEKSIADIRQTADIQLAQAKKEAEKIVQGAQESAQAKASEEVEVIIAAAREKSRHIDEDSIARAEEMEKVIVEVSQKIDDIFTQFKTHVQGEFADMATILSKARDNIEIESILQKNEAADINDNKIKDSKYLQGRLELIVVPPYDRSQINKLIEALKQIPDIKLDGEAGTEEYFSIYLAITEPIPLQNILHELSLVESSSLKGNTIRLKLRPCKTVNT